MSALVAINPIKPPDQRRPATLPSLPEWAERSSGAVRYEMQPTLDGKSFEKADILVLPSNLMPTTAQREAMVAHMETLRSFLSDTPANSADAETRIATTVSKLISVLAGERKSDLVEEARGDVYLDVLDDVPCWAVEHAARRWFKHDCGPDERGRQHDYKWAPDPGTLRQIAMEAVYAMAARIAKFQQVLDAREYIDCSKQIERGLKATVVLNNLIKKGDLETAGKLTVDRAIAMAETMQAAAE